MLVPPRSMSRMMRWILVQAGIDGTARAPDLLQRQTRQKICFDLLQGHALCLGNEDHEEDDEEDVQPAIKKKGITVAKSGQERQERHTDDGVGDPVCCGAEGHSEVASRKRINF